MPCGRHMVYASRALIRGNVEMPNKVAAHKQRISLLLDKNLLAEVDVAARRAGKSRTEYIADALALAVEPKPSPPPVATSYQIDELKKMTQSLTDRLALQCAMTEMLLDKSQKLLEESRTLPAVPIAGSPKGKLATLLDRLKGAGNS